MGKAKVYFENALVDILRVVFSKFTILLVSSALLLISMGYCATNAANRAFERNMDIYRSNR